MKYINLIDNEANDLLLETYNQIPVPSFRTKFFSDGTHKSIMRTETQENRAMFLLYNILCGLSFRTLEEFTQLYSAGEMTPRIEDIKNNVAYMADNSGKTSSVMLDFTKAATEVEILKSKLSSLVKQYGNFENIIGEMSIVCANYSNNVDYYESDFDLNNDGTITIDDLLKLKELEQFFPENILYSNILKAKNVYETEGCDISDVVSYAIGETGESGDTDFITMLSEKLDINENGEFDFDDFRTFISEYLFEDTLYENELINSGDTVLIQTVSSTQDTVYYTSTGTTNSATRSGSRTITVTSTGNSSTGITVSSSSDSQSSEPSADSGETYTIYMLGYLGNAHGTLCVKQSAFGIYNPIGQVFASTGYYSFCKCKTNVSISEILAKGDGGCPGESDVPQALRLDAYNYGSDTANNPSQKFRVKITNISITNHEAMSTEQTGVTGDVYNRAFDVPTFKWGLWNMTR